MGLALNQRRFFSIKEWHCVNTITVCFIAFLNIHGSLQKSVVDTFFANLSMHVI